MIRNLVLCEHNDESYCIYDVLQWLTEGGQNVAEKVSSKRDWETTWEHDSNKNHTDVFLRGPSPWQQFQGEHPKEHGEDGGDPWVAMPSRTHDK